MDKQTKKQKINTSVEREKTKRSYFMKVCGGSEGWGLTLKQVFTQRGTSYCCSTELRGVSGCANMIVSL